MILDALSEYRADWVLSGKATSTVDTHVALLRRFADESASLTVEDARRWITAAPTRSMQRKRAQSLRAFGRWSEQIGDSDLPWWRQIRVPVKRDDPSPQPPLRTSQTALYTSHTRVIVRSSEFCGERVCDVLRSLD